MLHTRRACGQACAQSVDAGGVVQPSLNCRGPVVRVNVEEYQVRCLN